MKKRTWALCGVVVAVLVGAGWQTKTLWRPEGAVAQAPRQQGGRAIPVEVATATMKALPVRLDALGTVTPIASVAVKSRLETEIVGVHFADGALVNEGDVLFTLDSRILQAQIRQAEGVLARDKAALEAAERDIRRYTELVAKSATPVTNLDNAKTAADTARANITADEAALENLKVQLTYTTVAALMRPSRSGISCGRATSCRWPPSTRSRRSISRSGCRSACCRRCAAPATKVKRRWKPSSPARAGAPPAA